MSVDGATDEITPETPALVSPTGIYNFQTLYIAIQPTFISIISLYLVLATFVVGTRLLAKRLDHRLYRIEDYAAFLAWAGFVGFCGFLLAGTYEGLGRHQWDVRAINILHISRTASYLQITYCVLLFVAKLALCLEYMRIFCPSRSGIIFWAIHVVIWSNLVAYLFAAFWLIFACRPREKIWNPSIPGSCLNPNANSLFSASWNTFSDITLLLLPIYSIWHLQMAMKRKIGLSLIFTIGLAGCAASTARIVYGVRLLNTQDITFVIVQNGLFSLTEFWIILICGSLPTLPWAFSLLLKKSCTTFGWSSQQSFNKRSGYHAKVMSGRQAPTWSNHSDQVEVMRSGEESYIRLENVNTSKITATNVPTERESYGD